MFGIEDPGIYMAYLLLFLCTAFAIVFGIVTWNKGQETDETALEKDLEWEKKDELLKKDI